MKRLLLIAAMVTAVSQDTFGMANTTVVKCPAGYVSVNGRCQKRLGNGGTQRVQPIKANTASNYGPHGTQQLPIINTQGGIQKPLPGSNSATWAPIINTQGGIQKQNINTQGGIQNLASRQAAMRRNCTKRGLTYQAVPKQVGNCVINTKGGVQKSALGRNGAGTRNMTGNKAGGSF